jgi:O-methyltransferase
MTTETKKLYLDFLKLVLVGAVSSEVQHEFWQTRRWPYIDHIQRLLAEPPHWILLNGRNWPDRGHTMIGLLRLNNLHESLDHIRLNAIPGDFLEAGVWRGGACIFMQVYNKLYDMDRRIFVCDTFNGMPGVELDRYPQDHGLEGTFGLCAATEDEVKNNFILYDALDDNIIFVKGLFKDTLHAIPVSRLSLLRADGDLYSSTMDIFTALEPKVSKDGVIIIDDYFAVPQCKQAVDEYLNNTNQTAAIVTIDWGGVYYHK